MDTETCSWCCDEVLYTSLVEAPDGAMVCRTCKRDAIADGIWDVLSRRK